MIISKVALVIYINNLLIAEKNEKNILHIKQLLKQKFEIKDLDEI